MQDEHGVRWHERRNEIVDAAAKLFAELGYHATGTAELCKATGLGKSSLYYHVESKENLLFLIHSRVMQEVAPKAEQFAASTESPTQRLREFGLEQLRIITRYPDHLWVFLHEFRFLEADHARQFRQARRIYEDSVRRVLDDGVASGEFRIKDTGLATLAWLGMFNYSYIWIRGRGQPRSERIAADFHEIFLSGIAAPPPTTSRRTAPEAPAKSARRVAGQRTRRP